MFEKIIAVKAQHDYTIRATFSDGTVKECDLKSEIETKPYYAPLRKNPALMSQVHPVGRGSAIGWTDEIDMASEWVWVHGKPVSLN